jgi:hypothetical protein
MILSGGLGSSVYVRESIAARFSGNPHPNATQVAVVPCVEPQLAVARGLLLDQQQRWESGNVSVLASRVARASYGVTVKQVYSPEQHFGEDIQDDLYEKNKRWAMNQIQWLICKVSSACSIAVQRSNFSMILGRYRRPEHTADQAVQNPACGRRTNKIVGC